MQNAINVDLIFETSWEVCNKVGGIYTVLSTKAHTLQTLYKDKVIFIGPDIWSDENPSPYFTEVSSLLRPWKDKTELPHGISVRIGRWNIPGRPIVILLKFNGMYSHKDYYYGEMWKQFGVDSLHAYGDYDEACAFSLAAGAVIESICNFKRMRHKNVLAHFNEWTTGMGLLYTKWKLPYIGTIFTTHATSIGRSICGNNKPLYDYLSGYNGDQMAQELNMQSKHSLEKAAAQNADSFTTVSDITAIECEQLLDRKPDIVTPNGFHNDLAPVKIKAKRARDISRKSLLSIANALTGRYFDENSFIIATSGRCEYRNKGIDIFIDAICRVSQQHPTRQILAFIMVPAWVKSPRTDLKERLESEITSRDSLSSPYITHELNNPWEDPIICRLRQIQDQLHSNTHLIYVPCYLDGKDGILNKNYYDLLNGIDLTIFPSYYEPWGYTPLESIAFGVPTMTTSLSGFGQWILNAGINGMEHSGVEVIERNDSNYNQVVENIAQKALYLSQVDRDVIEKYSKEARITSDKAEWTYFITYYVKAFAQALAKANKRRTINK